MPGNAAVKSTARAALSAFWLKAIVSTLIALAALAVLIYAETVFYTVCGKASVIVAVVFTVLFTFFVLCPLFLGVLRFFWRSTAGSGDNVTSVFYYLSNRLHYLKCLAFSASLLLRLLIVAFFSFLPFIAIRSIIGAPFAAATEQIGLYLQFLSSVFLSLGWVFFIIFSVRFYLAPALFVGCEDLHRSEIIYLSKLLSRSTAGAFIVLCFGMLGWLLLSVLGITMVFTVPYILAAYVVHCRYAVNHYNHKVKIINETDFPEFRSDF